MTRKASLIVITAVSALVLGVPAAWAKGQLPTTSPDAIERAVLARELSSRQVLQPVGDAFERAVASQALVGSRDRSEALNQRYGLGEYAIQQDAFERAAAVGPIGIDSGGISDRSVALNRMYQLGAFAPPTDAHDRVIRTTEPVSTPVVGSGRDLEWPQVGVGFGLGILLALGLGLALRATRVRELAH